MAERTTDVQSNGHLISQRSSVNLRDEKSTPRGERTANGYRRPTTTRQSEVLNAFVSEVKRTERRKLVLKDVIAEERRGSKFANVVILVVIGYRDYCGSRLIAIAASATARYVNCFSLLTVTYCVAR